MDNYIDLSDTDTNSDDDDLPDINKYSKVFHSRNEGQKTSPNKRTIRKQMSRQDFISDSSDVEIDEEKSSANTFLIPLKDRILNSCSSPKSKRLKVRSDFYSDSSDTEVNLAKPVNGEINDRGCNPVVLSGDSNDSTSREGNTHVGNQLQLDKDLCYLEEQPILSLLNRCSKNFEKNDNHEDKLTGDLCNKPKSSVHVIPSASRTKIANSHFESSVDGSNNIPKVRKKRTAEEIAEQKKCAQLKREQKEREKTEKQKAKEEKQAQRERESKLKKQFGLIKDSLGFLKVILDTHLVNSLGLGAVVMKSCDSLGSGLQCLVQDQSLPYTVSWKRSVTQVRDGSTVDREEDEVITVIPLVDFVQLVDNSKKKQFGVTDLTEKTLTDYVMFAQQLFAGSQLTPVVIGMEKYFRDQKTAIQRKYKEAVSSEPQKQKRKKGASDVVVSRIDVEEAVTEAQLQTGCVVKLLDTDEEFAQLVKSFTKAVAEKPAKKDRLNSIFSFHEEGSTGVRVDKSGVGLLKVWKQQLLQFKNVSPDIADAILALYPSPRLLTQAYRQCLSEKEAVQVLENIVVRRGAGVLETNRRIGKEMSKRIYTFMTSEEPDLIIK